MHSPEVIINIVHLNVKEEVAVADIPPTHASNYEEGEVEEEEDEEEEKHHTNACTPLKYDTHTRARHTRAHDTHARYTHTHRNKTKNPTV